MADFFWISKQILSISCYYYYLIIIERGGLVINTTAHKCLHDCTVLRLMTLICLLWWPKYVMAAE